MTNDKKPADENCQHIVTWNYKEPIVDNKSGFILIHGKCRVCEGAFQKTYFNPSYSMLNKAHEVIDISKNVIHSQRN